MKANQSNVLISRRSFLKSASIILAAPQILPSSVFGAANRINTAVIGLGDRGSQHLGALMASPNTDVLAVCDPFRKKAEQWQTRVNERQGKTTSKSGFKGCAAYQDYREILARPDIDAVFITAPENWHAIMSIDAMQAGKDVYCEKALSLTVAEGRAVCNAVRRYGRIFQIGTQQRSSRNFRHACELALNGYLGDVHTVNVSVPGGRSLPLAKPSTPPPDLDYDIWLRPAPWTPFNDIKCTFNWYFMADYCAGWIQSWGVHHVDIALWGMPQIMASTMVVEGKAIFPTEGMANTSINWNVTCTPPKGPKLVFTDHKYQEHGVRFIGDKGWVHVVRGGIRAEPEELLELKLKPTEQHLQVSNHHVMDFLDSMKSRRDPVAPVEGGHAATTLTLVADIATRLQRKLTWDWDTEQFRGDSAANAMLNRAMRSPWAT